MIVLVDEAPGRDARPCWRRSRRIAIAYVLFRLQWRGDWPVFEQAVGLGFGRWKFRKRQHASARFHTGSTRITPLSTIANALFAEPGRGVFRIVQAWSEGQVQAWQVAHVGSSIGLTGLIGWWGAAVASRRAQTGGRSSRAPSSHGAVVLLACGALSFNYSRERLAGMAVVFYGSRRFTRCAPRRRRR